MAKRPHASMTTFETIKTEIIQHTISSYIKHQTKVIKYSLNFKIKFTKKLIECNFISIFVL